MEPVVFSWNMTQNTFPDIVPREWQKWLTYYWRARQIPAFGTSMEDLLLLKKHAKTVVTWERKEGRIKIPSGMCSLFQVSTKFKSVTCSGYRVGERVLSHVLYFSIYISVGLQMTALHYCSSHST